MSANQPTIPGTTPLRCAFGNECKQVTENSRDIKHFKESFEEFKEDVKKRLDEGSKKFDEAATNLVATKDALEGKINKIVIGVAGTAILLLLNLVIQMVFFYLKKGG